MKPFKFQKGALEIESAAIENAELICHDDEISFGRMNLLIGGKSVFCLVFFDNEDGVRFFEPIKNPIDHVAEGYDFVFEVMSELRSRDQDIYRKIGRDGAARDFQRLIGVDRLVSALESVGHMIDHAGGNR